MGAPGGGGSRRVVRWGADLRPAPREGVRRPRRAGRGGAPWERQVRSIEGPGVLCGKGAGDTREESGGGDASDSRRLGIGVRARLTKVGVAKPWRGPGPGPRSRFRAHRAGTRPLGPAFASEAGTGVRGPVRKLGEPRAPCAGQGFRSQTGDPTGSEGLLRRGQSRRPLQVRVPRSPPAAWSQWRSCRRSPGAESILIPRPGAGHGGALRSALAPTVAMATRPPSVFRLYLF